MSKSKDPAFLFYSRDFYEGTRTMLPEERACYIDLLIYQHQHGTIPDDVPRMTMYCSGVAKATLEATLKAKFKLTSEGWVNEKLDNVMNDRKEHSAKKSLNGKVGQIIKKAAKLCKSDDLDKFKSFLFEEIGKERAVEMLEKGESTLEGLLKLGLSNKAIASAIADANAIEDVIEDYKEGHTVEESNKSKARPLSVDEVKKYFEHLGLNGISQEEAEKFWAYYKSVGWKVGKNPMKDWKSAAVGWKTRIPKDRYHKKSKHDLKPEDFYKG